MTRLKEHRCGSSTSVDTGVETQGCSYPQTCPHMGKVDVGCGEPVVHGSTDDLGRKEERAEALRARSWGYAVAPARFPSLGRAPRRCDQAALSAGSTRSVGAPKCGDTAHDKAPEPVLGGLRGCLIAGVSETCHFQRSRPRKPDIMMRKPM